MRLFRKVLREIAPFAFKRFTTSDDYWKRRYRYGGHSGSGSRGSSAQYKAEVVNRLCAEHDIATVLDLGCGDGQNCSLFTAKRYLGLDISPDALALARASSSRPGWSFIQLVDMRPEAVLEIARRIFPDRGVDLALSLDVIYHLVEDEIYANYLDALGRVSSRFCLVYSFEEEHPAEGHVRSRAYSGDLARRNPAWRLRDRLPNPLYGAEWQKQPHFCLFERSAN